MTLKQFRDILLSITEHVYHFEAHKDDEYIVWHEVGGISLAGDNKTAEKGTRIAVDYFTKNEYDTLHEKLESTLSEYDEIFLSDYITDFEADTGYIHYAYTCEVI